MIEYLIRTAETHEWPGFDQSRLAAVLIPAGSQWEQSDGWGDIRMRLSDAEVSLSGEMGGWQVTFEGSIPEADAQRTVQIVASQIQDEVGEPVDILRLS